MDVNGYFILFGYKITWYAILGLVGMTAAFFLCYKRSKRFKISKDDVINMTAYAMIGVLAGAKLLALICAAPFFIHNWDKIIWNLRTVEIFIGTGFVFYGGLAGCIASIYIYCRQYKVDFKNALDLAVPAIPLFHFFGRIGCFTAGCCGGVDGFPLQLVEAGLNLMIFVAMLIIQNKSILRGKTIYFYLIIYPACRFILEFFRGDPGRGFIWVMSVSQWISLFLFIFSAVRLFQLFHKKHTKIF